MTREQAIQIYSNQDKTITADEVAEADVVALRDMRAWAAVEKMLGAEDVRLVEIYRPDGRYACFMSYFADSGHDHLDQSNELFVDPADAVLVAVEKVEG